MRFGNARTIIAAFIQPFAFARLVDDIDIATYAHCYSEIKHFRDLTFKSL